MGDTNSYKVAVTMRFTVEAKSEQEAREALDAWVDERRGHFCEAWRGPVLVADVRLDGRARLKVEEARG